MGCSLVIQASQGFFVSVSYCTTHHPSAPQDKGHWFSCCSVLIEFCWGIWSVFIKQVDLIQIDIDFSFTTSGEAGISPRPTDLSEPERLQDVAALKLANESRVIWGCGIGKRKLAVSPGGKLATKDQSDAFNCVVPLTPCL